MIHVGKNTRSRIVSKGISAGRSRNCYRGLVQVGMEGCQGRCGSGPGQVEMEGGAWGPRGSVAKGLVVCRICRAEAGHVNSYVRTKFRTATSRLYVEQG